MSEVLFNKENDILIVELVGEINISEQSKKIIVDMEKVPFMDSSGLGMLISLYKYVNENQGKIVYTGLSEYILKILGFAKLDKIFIISDNIQSGKLAL